MESEWYTHEAGGKVEGPLSAEILKSRAQAGIIKPDTFVRKGRGPWIEATKVRGLFPDIVECPPAQAALPKRATVLTEQSQVNNTYFLSRLRCYSQRARFLFCLRYYASVSVCRTARRTKRKQPGAEKKPSRQQLWIRSRGLPEVPLPIPTALSNSLPMASNGGRSTNVRTKYSARRFPQN